jgi:hypothetical protein
MSHLSRLTSRFVSPMLTMLGLLSLGFAGWRRRRR